MSATMIHRYRQYREKRRRAVVKYVESMVIVILTGEGIFMLYQVTVLWRTSLPYSLPSRYVHMV